MNSAGDRVLAEFASVVETVNCAVEVQKGLKAENASLAPERRMELRIGVNLGDVMVEGDQIYGDGVNVVTCAVANELLGQDAVLALKPRSPRDRIASNS